MSQQNDFDIRFDEQACIITAKMRGFWPEATLQAFNDQMAAAIRAATTRVAIIGILSDATGFGVQSSEIAQGFARNETDDRSKPAGPLAFIASSALVAVQAKRVLTNAQVQVFTDVTAGRQWLEGVLAELKAPG
jgi:uncharacterized membrane protein